LIAPDPRPTELPSRPSMSARASSLLLVSSCLGALGCGGGERVSLGRGAAPTVRWAEPRRIVELESDAVDDNPTLTGDLLEIYFTSRREGGEGSTDIWFARRRDPADPFDPPEPVTELNTSEFESSPAVSHDGLTLWFGSERDGGLGDVDIWVSTRPDRDSTWSEPEHVESLSSPAADIPRPLGQHGTVMPLGSRRNDEGLYWTYLARRNHADGTFEEPRLIEELATDDSIFIDAFLSEDGLTLWFNRAPLDGNADLYRAQRPSVDAPFDAAVPLEELNTDADERDPWLSPDGKQLYFTSDRDGKPAIYVSDAL